jgi:DNA repair protein RadC
MYVPKMIKTPADSYSLLKHIYDPGELCLLENFYVMALNRRNEVIGLMHLSKGGCTGTIVDVKMVMVALLGCAAQSFVISHNHPSGSLMASQQDMRITKTLQEAAKLLDMCLLDHVIVTHTGYFSFAEQGLL